MVLGPLLLPAHHPLLQRRFLEWPCPATVTVTVTGGGCPQPGNHRGWQRPQEGWSDICTNGKWEVDPAPLRLGPQWAVLPEAPAHLLEFQRQMF